MSSLYVPIRRAAYQFLGSLLPKTSLVTVLCYHSIAENGWDFSVTPSEFKKQISYLSNRYQFITLSDLYDYTTGKKSISSPCVILTFDDGYSSILNVSSFLKSQGIKPTVFLLSSPRDANRNELNNALRLLTAPQIKKLISMGWEIGCHTATHPNVFKLSPSQLGSEIINSKIQLEKQLGLIINYFAYPKGRYTPSAVKAVEQAGYKLALTMDDSYVNSDTDPLKIPRIGVDGTHSFSEFKVLPTSGSRLIRKLLKSLYV